MKYLKKFEKFRAGAAAPAPAREAPGKAPSEPTTKPGTKPNTKPSKPSPIRRDKPAVEPAPMAKTDDSDMPKATIEDVINKYANLTDQK